MPELVVTQDPALSRYVAEVDGARIGEAAYRDTEEGRVFTHTEIDPAQQDHGYGTRLVRAALEDTLDAGLKPIAQCSMVRNFLAEHPGFTRSRTR